MIYRVFVGVAIIVVCIFQFKMAMLVIPITIVDIRSRTIDQLQDSYRIPKKMAIAIWNAHVVSGYDPVFIAELVLSESNFNNNALSSKGYKGALQTPTKTGYLNADMVHGIEILREKFKMYRKPIDAIAAYKGGKDVPQARRQAEAFLKKYRERRNRDGII